MDPIEVSYRGPIRELAINFYPLGFCRFIRGAFLEEVPGSIEQEAPFCKHWENNFYIKNEDTFQDILKRAKSL